MTAKSPMQPRLRVAHLNPRGPTPVDLRPNADDRAAMAGSLGILGLPAARLTGQIAPEQGGSWVLSGQLTARVVQPCIVTLEPVETPINEPVRRVYSPHFAEPEADLTEMPDDEVEPLGSAIDLAAVMVEALSLALPLYPRAPGAGFEGDGGDPITAEPDTRKPFAGLGDLLKRKD